MVDIYYVRHGQSQANADHKIYFNTPDHLIPLTERGKEQGDMCGRTLANHLKKRQSSNSLNVVLSPYKRATDTWERMKMELKSEGIDVLSERVDYNFRERDWCNFSELSYNTQEIYDREKDSFFYTFENGESALDVGHRALTGLIQAVRNAEKTETKSVVIVSHGVAFKGLMVVLFGLKPEWFKLLALPRNCEIVRLFYENGSFYGDLMDLRGVPHRFHAELFC